MAWALRVVAVLGVQYYLDHVAVPPRQFVIKGDAEGYWQLAHKIVAGEPYEIYTPPRQVLRMPGFPLLLAISLQLFGESLLAARLVLATIGAMGCVGVYFLGKRLQGHRIGMIAGGLAAVSPIFIGFSVIELTETAFAVSLVWGLLPLTRWCFIHASGSPPAGSCITTCQLCSREAILSGVLAGLLAGVGCYLRPSWLLFPACLVMWLWLLRRTRVYLLMAVVTVAAMIGSLLPWGLRNLSVTGHFTLTTFWMGPSLCDGWNPQNKTGDSDMTFFDQENLMSRMSEYEMDREYRDRAWAFAFQNPDQVAALAWKKTLRYWNPFPNAPQFRDKWVLRWVSLGWFVVLFVPALIGAWHLRRSLGLLAITAGPILYFAVLHLVFVSSVRYRLPGEYPLLVLSAVGIDRLFQMWRATRRVHREGEASAENTIAPPP